MEKATVALEESNGLIDSVTDDEILEAYQLMTSKEGVFSEPASNASIAGLIKYNVLENCRKVKSSSNINW